MRLTEAISAIFPHFPPKRNLKTESNHHLPIYRVKHLSLWTVFEAAWDDLEKQRVDRPLSTLRGPKSTGMFALLDNMCGRKAFLAGTQASPFRGCLKAQSEDLCNKKTSLHAQDSHATKRVRAQQTSDRCDYYIPAHLDKFLHYTFSNLSAKEARGCFPLA